MTIDALISHRSHLGRLGSVAARETLTRSDQVVSPSSSPPKVNGMAAAVAV